LTVAPRPGGRSKARKNPRGLRVEELNPHPKGAAMPSTAAIAMHIAGLLVLPPLILYGFIAGPGLPESSFLEKYFRAETYLNLAGSLFLVVLWLSCAGKVARHFGYLDPASWDRLQIPIGLAFAVTSFAYLGLWIRALIKVHRAGSRST
jgi:hypothetical protein